MLNHEPPCLGPVSASRAIVCCLFGFVTALLLSRHPPQTPPPTHPLTQSHTQSHTHTITPHRSSQGKLAEMKVEKAMESVNRVARRSNEPGLRRVSQDLNLVRNSIKLARASMGSTGVCTFACVCNVCWVDAPRRYDCQLLWELRFLGLLGLGVLLGQQHRAAVCRHVRPRVPQHCCACG